MQLDNPQQFSERAWQSIIPTFDIAKACQHKQMESEHLFKAMIQQDRLVTYIISEAGVDITQFCQEMNSFIQEQPKILRDINSLSLGQSIQTLLDRADNYRKECGDYSISIKHLILAYPQDERFGKQLFSSFNLEEDQLNNVVCKIQQSIRGFYWNGNNSNLINKPRLAIDYNTINSVAEIVQTFNECQNTEEKIHLFESLSKKLNPPIDSFIEILKRIKNEDILALTIYAFGIITHNQIRLLLKNSDDLLLILCRYVRHGVTDLIRWSAATAIENIGFDFIAVSLHLEEKPVEIIRQIVHSKKLVNF
jgi:hypothetical protein